MWTEFIDMHLGGEWQIESYACVYIELPRADAIFEFETLFGIDPTLRIDGLPLYHIFECEDIRQATAFARGCKWDPETKEYLEQSSGNVLAPYMTLDDYLLRDDICVIYTIRG